MDEASSKITNFNWKCVVIKTSNHSPSLRKEDLNEKFIIKQIFYVPNSSMIIVN